MSEENETTEVQATGQNDPEMAMAIVDSAVPVLVEFIRELNTLIDIGAAIDGIQDVIEQAEGDGMVVRPYSDAKVYAELLQYIEDMSNFLDSVRAIQLATEATEATEEETS